MKRYAILVILFALTATAQTANSPSAGAVQNYTNPELHLTFAYPAELKPLDASHVAAEGRRLIYGEDTTPDSDQSKLPDCTKPLLAVGMGRAPGSSTGAGASIVLFRVDPRCVPAKALKNQKAIGPFLRNVTRQGVTFLGMAPIGDPMFYELQEHRVCFAAAQGTPVTQSDLQTSGSELTAVVAALVNGQVVAWMIEADSLAAFNRLLASQVDFGAGKPQALYPVSFSAPAGGPEGP